jgi:hypothetical protein
MYTNIGKRLICFFLQKLKSCDDFLWIQKTFKPDSNTKNLRDHLFHLFFKFFSKIKLKSCNIPVLLMFENDT